MAPDHKRWNQQSYLLVPFFMVVQTLDGGDVMTTRIMEISKPRFTLGEQKNLVDGKAITLFGVKIEHRAGKWFRLDAPDIQSLEHILAILTGGYAGE